MNKVLLILFLFLFQNNSFGQDRILYLNGTEDSCRVIDTVGGFINAEFKYKNGLKIRKIERDDVFSIDYGSTKKEDVIYKQDTLSQENYFTENDMRSMIAGERDAIITYKTTGPFISSAIIGAASGVFMPYWLTPIIPAIWVGLNSSKWIKIKRKNVSDKKYLKEDMYVVGYGRTARGKRVQSSLKGAGIGLVSGILTQIIIGSLKNK
jgi:hypothetical protein